jgi:hypothetical protein
MLEGLGLRDMQIVQRVVDLTAGIQELRDDFGNYKFDEANCAEELRHLSLYRKDYGLSLPVLFACGSRLSGGRPSLPGCRCLASRRPPLPRPSWLLPSSPPHVEHAAYLSRPGKPTPRMGL